MDDRENSVGVAEVMYTVAVIAYAELMVLVIDLGHLIHTVNMNWILTPFTQCFNFVIPVLMQGANLILSNIAMKLWTLMSSWYGWLAFFFDGQISLLRSEVLGILDGYYLCGGED